MRAFHAGRPEAQVYGVLDMHAFGSMHQARYKRQGGQSRKKLCDMQHTLLALVYPGDSSSRQPRPHTHGCVTAYPFAHTISQALRPCDARPTSRNMPPPRSRSLTTTHPTPRQIALGNPRCITHPVECHMPVSIINQGLLLLPSPPWASRPRRLWTPVR